MGAAIKFGNVWVQQSNSAMNECINHEFSKWSDMPESEHFADPHVSPVTIH